MAKMKKNGGGRNEGKMKKIEKMREKIQNFKNRKK